MRRMPAETEQPVTLDYARKDSRRRWRHVWIDVCGWVVILSAVGLYAQHLIRARREIPPGTLCANTLYGIAAGLYMYAQDGDRFPDSLTQVLRMNREVPLWLYCPAPDSLQSGYTYIPGQGVSDNPKNVVVYEHACNHGRFCNVLFVDGHVEALTEPQLDAALARTKADLANWRMRVCSSNLRAIGQDLNSYTVSNFDRLIADHDVAPSLFRCPAAASTNCAYTLIPDQATTDDPRNVLAYENTVNHPRGQNVLFVDGHVDYLTPQQLQQALARTRKNLACRAATRTTSDGRSSDAR